MAGIGNVVFRQHVLYLGFHDLRRPGRRHPSVSSFLQKPVLDRFDSGHIVMHTNPFDAPGTGPESLADAIRSEKIWFTDGNIILHAKHTLFKAHLSVLAYHSSVFADMVSIPQSLGSSSIDSNVVQLQDSPADVEAMLETMYSHRYDFLSYYS